MRTPAAAPDLVISATVVSGRVRCTMKYFAMKSSPSVRAISIFATCCRVDSRRALASRNCVRSVAWSLLRPSAEPPKDLNAIAAATRLPSKSAPNRTRMAMRGSATDRPFQRIAGAGLEFLGIRHIQVDSEQRFGLRGRREGLHMYRAEQIGR